MADKESRAAQSAGDVINLDVDPGREPASKGPSRIVAKPFASITTYLIGLLLTVVVPVLALAAILAAHWAVAERRVVEAQRADVTNNLNNLIEREIKSIEGLLMGLSASPELNAGRYSALPNLTTALAGPSHLRAVVVVDRDGAPVASSSGVDPSVSTKPTLQALIQQRTVVSDLLADPGSGRKYFVVGMPISIGGVDHALGAVLEAEGLQRLFNEGLLRTDWVAALVDRKGIFLARSRLADQLVGKSAHPSVVAAAQSASGVGSFSNTTLDGVQTASSYRRSAYGWTAVVAVPIDILNAPLNRAVRMIGLVAAALAAFGLALAYLLGSHIAGATRSLKNAAIEVAEGRPPSRMSYPIAELQEVTSVFDFAASMASGRKAAEQGLRDSEERLRLAVEAGRLGTCDVDMVSGQAVWSETMFGLLGFQSNASGQATLDMWRSRIHPDDRDRVMAAKSRAKATQERFVSEHRILRADSGAVRWLHLTGQFHVDGDGKPTRFVGVARDITERRRIEDELRASEARYRTSLAVGQIGSWETCFDDGRRLWSPEGLALFDLTLAGGVGHVGGNADELRAAVHPDDRHLVEQLEQRSTTQDTIAAAFRTVRSDGSIVWFTGRSQAVARDADGRVSRMICVVADVTERKAAEERIEFLMREISHRSKNQLAVIQAIAGQTIRTAESLQDFEGRFRMRLRALGASHDVLIARNWRSAPLGELVRRQLAAFDGGSQSRIEMSGPAVHVDANAAQNIGLALHELATNAGKYGSLSVPAGRVAIRWQFVGADVELSWIETNGPRVTPPLRKGFGHEVIEKMAARSINSTVTMEFAPAGLRWTLVVPATCLMDVASSPAFSSAAVPPLTPAPPPTASTAAASGTAKAAQQRLPRSA